MKNFITFNLLKQKQRHDQVGEENFGGEEFGLLRFYSVNLIKMMMMNYLICNLSQFVNRYNLIIR